MKSLAGCLLVLLLGSLAKADCRPLTVDKYVVSIGEDEVLIKSPTGDSTVLEVPDGTRVVCETLKPSKAKSGELPLVEMTYYPGAGGTRVIIDDENFVLIDLKETKFAIEPITLEETQRRPLHEDHTVENSIAWTKKNGALVLEKTDLETKETTQVWPEIAPSPEVSASPSPTPTPTASPDPARTAPVGSSDI